MIFKKLAALAAILLFALAGEAAAHPPSNIRLMWDGAGHILYIEADHQVHNTAKHYIMSMLVSGPSGQLVSERYESQATNEGFSEAIAIEAVAPGDTLTVELTCNIMGSATKEITIN